MMALAFYLYILPILILDDVYGEKMSYNSHSS